MAERGKPIGLGQLEPGLSPLILCFFLSGFAALLYQIVWTRQFAFVFGTSELALAVVLAAYMGGLAAGAGVANRALGRIRRPLLVYGVLELGVAGSALTVPAALDAATSLYVAAYGGHPTLPDAGGGAPTLFQLGTSGAILLLPTGLMGATLPVLVRHAVRSETGIGSRVGGLYSANAGGAVMGAAAAGFALLPALGLSRTLWVGVGINGLLFLVAAVLSRGVPPLQARLVMPRGEGGSGGWILPLMLVSGAVSFSYEVLWTRLLVHLLGEGVRAAATMLACFLAGIAIGSGIASRIASRPDRSARAFAWAQLATGMLSLLAFFALGHLQALLGPLSASSARAAVAAGLLLPGTLFIGATFPLAVRVLARSPTDAGRATARVYAWNTIGSIAGALGAGFVLLPRLGYEGTITLAVLANLGLALATRNSSPLRQRAALAGVVVLAGLMLLPPDPPWALLRTSPLTSAPTPGAVAYYGVGRNATVLTLERGGSWHIRTNGLPEAVVDARGAPPPGGSFPQWLAATPSLLRPEARSMLVVGLGGGVLLEAVPSRIEAIDVVELEPEVIRANRAISGRRRRDPLSDPRVRLVVNDARGALLLTRRRYDVIVSQPSHPWTSASAHLYTREFFELAQEHLEPDGVFAQWMALRFVDAELVRSIAATLLDVFQNVQIHQPTGAALLFAASDAPLEPAEAAARAIATGAADFVELGVFAPEDFVAGWVLDDAGARDLAALAPSNTDDRNLVEMRSFPGSRGGYPRFESGETRDVLLRGTPGLDRVQIVQRLLARRVFARARRVAEHSLVPLERSTALGLVEAAVGEAGEARRHLERALELDPEAPTALSALLRLRRRAWLAGDASVRALAERADASQRAVLAGWAAEDRLDWDAVSALEPELARVGPASPLFPDATRLRAGWRLAQATPARLSEAVALADGLIPVATSAGLVLRAEVQSAAGEASAGLASLRVAATRLGATRGDADLARAALRVLEELPAELLGEPARDRLRSRLARPLRRRP